MGVVLSLPLAGASVVSSWIGSCCGAAAMTALSNTLCKSCAGCTCSSSIATRIAYAILFLVNSTLSWIMLTPWVIRNIEKLTMNFVKITCNGEQCTGFVAVHRINFSLAIFHLILGCMMIGVRSSRDKRSKINNGYWGLKIFFWIFLIFISFLIPEGFYLFWGNHISIILAAIFVIIGLVLLVDFAHSWAENCVINIEDSDSNLWKFVLLSSTVGMYIGSIILTIIMYIFFASSGCSMNQAAITINLILILIITILSVTPIIQEHTPSAGLAQSAMVSIYCSYLTMSAVASEPDDKNCNPLIRSSGARVASIIIGAIFTMVAIAYTTTRAASKTSALKPTISNSSTEYTLLDTNENDHGLSNREPTASELRQEAIRQAVAIGSLPSSALAELYENHNEGDDDDDDDDDLSSDDERNITQYNYTVFHFIFLVATQYVATLLTMNVKEDEFGDFVPIGRTYFNSWLKIISAWLCYILYTWTLIAPILLPDRFD